MKKIVLILLTGCVLMGCVKREGIYDKLDNQIVKDRDGNYYLLQHDFGNEYIIKEVKNFDKF